MSFREWYLRGGRRLRVRSDSAAERRKDPGKEVYKAQYFTRLSIADFRILSSLFLRNFKIVGAASGEPGGGDLLVPGEGAGRGDPGQSFGEDFAGGVGIDEGFDAEAGAGFARVGEGAQEDRKSTRLNSSHRTISYAVFCLKK